MSKQLIIKVSRRSGHAQAAIHRRAPTFKHRNEPRGGASNASFNLLKEAEEEALLDRASHYGEGW